MIYEVFPSGSRSFKAIPVESHIPVKLGSRVVIQNGESEKMAYVVDEGGESARGRIISVLDTVLDRERLELALWISERFLSPPGRVLDLSFPKILESYVEKFVVPNTDLVDIKPSALSEFIEEHGDEKLKGFLKKGYVRIERVFRFPRINYDPNSKVFVKVSIGDVVKKDLSEKEIDLVKRLLIEGELEVREILGDFPVSILRELEKKGIVGVGASSTSREIDLTEDQRKAMENLKAGVNLLMGPTGSGKTEVYLEFMKDKKTLYLVPEVSLIPQTLKRITARFPKYSVGVYHSYLSPSRRAWTWIATVSGKLDVLVGTRSALFVPRKWDLIIVDEEHDEGYYQREGVVYDAVESAIKLSELYSIPLILGSATPRLKHYYLARKGIHNFVVLRRRALAAEPEVVFVNMREERRVGSFAKRVLDEMKSVLRNGKKIMIFVRRKGFGRIVCERCGAPLKCPKCDVNMVYHSYKRVFKCHVCGYEVPAFDTCPRCGGPLRVVGTGTERVERELKRIFPNVRIARADREVLSRPDKIVKILENLSRGKLDILVGTKMISKGIDLPGVGLMVVMDVDGGLAIPDFSSRLRVFQEIVQAVGRAGREIRGKAIVQYYDLDEGIRKGVFESGIDDFYESELRRRELFGYPPFKHVIHIVKSSSSAVGAKNELEYLASELIRFGEEVLGPSEHPIFRVRGKYRYHLVVKTSELSITLKKISEVLKFVRKGCKIYVDPPGLFVQT